MNIIKMASFISIVVINLSILPCKGQNSVSFYLKKDSCENELKFVLSITNNTPNKIYFNGADISYRIRKANKDYSKVWNNHNLNNDQPIPKCQLKLWHRKIPDSLLPRIKELKDSLTNYLAQRNIHFDGRDITSDVTDDLIFLDIGETFIVEDVASSKVHPHGSYDVMYFHRLGGWGEVVSGRKSYKLSTPKNINGYLKFEGRVKSKKVDFNL